MALRYFCESNFSETSLRLVCLLKFCNFVFKRCVLADHINLKYVQHVRLILFNVCVYWGCECNTLWSFWTYSRLSLSEVGLSYTHLFILNVLQLSYGIHTLWNAHVSHSNMLIYSCSSDHCQSWRVFSFAMYWQSFSSSFPLREDTAESVSIVLILFCGFLSVLYACCYLFIERCLALRHVARWSHLLALCTYVLVVGDFLHYPYSLFISSAICPCELSSNWVVCILSFRTRLR